jgi:succinate dehydrogenase / fumarate reductase, flavoprotein subunit
VTTVVRTTLDARISSGPIEAKWQRRRAELRLIGPSQRARHKVIVVGTGLAGASAAAALGEQGYNVLSIFFHDSPRRAHSVAAQGGINAAKNYRNDGDSVFRLFYDTIEGGDYRSREDNVYRLAELSLAIIDQAVAQGVPFAREYGGTLANRSFGGVLVSRTFYCRGQTGQQLLLGAYQALLRQASLGPVTLLPRTEMLDLVTVEGRAVGVVTRDLTNGRIRTFLGDAVVLASGGYGNVYHLSTNAKGSNATAIWRAHKRGALFANPCFTQIHPTCIPASGPRQSKLTLMSESLRNDGRLWVPRAPGDARPPRTIPEPERDYFLERRYPRYGNLVPRDIASRAVKDVCDEGRGVGPTGLGVYLDLSDAIARLGAETIRERYGNLLDMYRHITGENPMEQPMRIFPAIHYTMGGLWVDYHLMSNVGGLFVIGEANFSDHGANRLGASALMQGLADGYFILPCTLGDYLAEAGPAPVDSEHPAVRDAERAVVDRLERLVTTRGHRSAEDLHRHLGRLLWETCGMSRDRAGLKRALARIPEMREAFWREVRVPTSAASLNQELEKAGRVADYFEVAELMCQDALHREESCGSHFRQEHQSSEGEPLRDDQRFAYVAAWEFSGPGRPPVLHREPLSFQAVIPGVRSYA